MSHEFFITFDQIRVNNIDDPQQDYENEVNPLKQENQILDNEENHISNDNGNDETNNSSFPHTSKDQLQFSIPIPENKLYMNEKVKKKLMIKPITIFKTIEIFSDIPQIDPNENIYQENSLESIKKCFLKRKKD